VLRRTEITYVCDGCGQVLDAEPTRFELMPDDAPAAAEFKTDTGYVTPAGYEPEREPVDAPAANVETNAPEFKNVTGKHHGAAPGTTTVSVLKKTRAELVPLALVETYDMPSAFRLADTYAPAEDAGRAVYKTGLVHIYHGNPGKALELLPNILDERACAMLVHLANRPPALAPA